MDPWWDAAAQQIVNDIRGPMKQATLFRIDHAEALKLRTGIRAWLSVAS